MHPKPITVMVDDLLIRSRINTPLFGCIQLIQLKYASIFDNKILKVVYMGANNKQTSHSKAFVIPLKVRSLFKLLKRLKHNHRTVCLACH